MPKQVYGAGGGKMKPTKSNYELALTQGFPEFLNHVNNLRERLAVVRQERNDLLRDIYKTIEQNDIDERSGWSSSGRVLNGLNNQLALREEEINVIVSALEEMRPQGEAWQAYINS
jgi:hypothetical protein